MRIIAGILSVLIPIGLIAISLAEPMVWPRGSSVFDGARVALGVSALLIMAAFIWHALNSKVVPTDKRRIWVVVLLFANIFALPFYWLYYVRSPQRVN